MVSTGLLKAGGIFHILFAVFHLFWPKLFNWKDNLKSLDVINKALLPIMSGLFIYIYAAVGLVSFFYSDVLLESKIGGIFLLSVAGFWLVRAIMQFKYFNIKEKEAFIFLGFFITGIALYAIPVII